MIVMLLDRVTPGVRGHLSRWLVEVRAGVQPEGFPGDYDYWMWKRRDEAKVRATQAGQRKAKKKPKPPASSKKRPAFEDL